MPNVYMNDVPVVQTVGAGGIGVSPPVPIEKVEKIAGNVREMEEVTAPASRLPNPIGADDGTIIEAKDDSWQSGGFSVPNPKNASDNMVLAVEDGEYKIVDPSVQTDVADLVADPYSTESTYAVGDPTVYENELYICNTAITQGEAWTAAHWTKKPLGEAMVDGLGAKVDKTQTVNGKVLSGNITLTAEDIGYDDSVDPHTANSIGAAVSDLKSALDRVEDAVEDMIVISETQPISEDNKIWIDSDADNVQIPTVEDLWDMLPTVTLEDQDTAVFDDGANAIIKNIVVAIDLAGTGCTEANITRVGKNLFNKTLPLKEGYLLNSSGQETENVSYAYSEYYTPVKPDTNYIFSGDPVDSGTYNSVCFYDDGKNFISRFLPSTGGVCASFTTPNNCHYIRVNFGNANSRNLNTVQLEVGSTASTYEAFNGTTINIPFPAGAGTVYEGNLENDGTDVWKLTVSNNEYDIEVSDILKTVYGQNNIWSDTGEITTVTYRADIQKYISNIIANL